MTERETDRGGPARPGMTGDVQEARPGDVRRASPRALTGILAILGLHLYSYRGKVVVIAGGSRGLALALARRLSREGARLALLARDEGELNRAREDLRRRNGDALIVKCDVRDRADVENAIRRVTAELGGVDVLINNAGVIQVGPIETMTLEDYQESIQTHLFGPLHTSLAVIPEMRRRGGGRIINISSIGGKIPIPHMVPYNAGKFALVGLSAGMRAELLQDGIVVTTVAPGLMRTGSIYNAFFKGRNREEFTWFSIVNSMPLLSMSAERAARVILRGARMGRAEITPSIFAKIGARLHGLMPGLMTDVAGLAGRLLPGPNGAGTRRVRGRDSQTRLSSSVLTILNQRAAQDLNQLAPGQIEGPTGTTGLPPRAGQAGKAGEPGQVTQPGQAGRAGQSGQVASPGQVRQEGQSGQVASPGQVRQEGQSGQVASPGKVGQEGQSGPAAPAGQQAPGKVGQPPKGGAGRGGQSG